MPRTANKPPVLRNVPGAATWRWFVAILTVSGAIGVALPAAAQTWPSQNLTLVVPFTPGGSTDILARLLSQKLTEALGQSVVVESRPGAGGALASGQVARARPDGNTLLMGHIGTLGVNPSLYKELPYDPIKSFAHISLLAKVHNVLVVHPSVPATDVAGFIAYSRKNPGKLNYGSGGNGSAAHIAAAAFMVATGADYVHVPYRGTAPMLTDLLSGQLQFAMTGAPTVLQHISVGSLRALGVSATQRIAAAPNIPTIAEAGVPGFEASQWYGVMAPAGTPAPIVARLNGEVRKALASKEIIDALERDGAEPWPTSPEEFRAHIEREIPRWAAIVEAAKIRAD